ncbi:MAG: HlyD family efflux transporter periplasmic adaptor subunit [Bacteroidales bacterium]|jgi:HlyD family secretion protein|nr:HlyD family efflux transporter periplasmic adaptor subunit [Bacteroidales bacterium]MDD2264916.1 HlyD family efflux transporter periplasmic adaptor subunit [Bacteroidales bacterium]MDD2831910.1 HlyD family efflux transporter periplasmic adaptor subunit [Bacteroidales bacterium]MDD3209378.1 HlyD family efflux transporter periplasmic adaptor subunit [Bacteroidales bacterium]MDD3698044.1 HlyD family efflux transporter periplasmic adaptor subunit [Bacteroidales bacterium]
MDRKIEKKKGFQKKHILWIAGGLVFAFILFKIISDAGTKSLRIDRDKITVSHVTRGQFNDYIRVTGQVEPIATIYLDAEEGGRVKERLIEEGATVKAGDIILRLENRTLYQEIMASESNLAQKENMLRQTRINFENQMIETRRRLLASTFDIQKKERNFNQQQALYEDKLIPAETYRIAKEDYEYAKQEQEINRLKAKNDSMIMVSEMTQLITDLTKMRQTLQLVYERLNNLNVKAPVDGQLGMLDAEIGQSIGQGTRIGQINVLTNFKVQAMIDEHYIDRVRHGLAGTLDRQDKLYNLNIRKVYPEVRQGQFRIDMVFDGETPENIRTGQTYYINLELGQPQDAIMLPRGGFFQSTGGQWVYVLDKSGDFATRRSIRIGKQNPQFYEVIEGLNPGEQVITSGYENFGDNDKLILN